jgi:hypothetical protein
MISRFVMRALNQLSRAAAITWLWTGFIAGSGALGIARPTFAASLPSFEEAAAAKKDLWGEAAMARPEGPTYDFFKDLIPPPAMSMRTSAITDRLERAQLQSQSASHFQRQRSQSPGRHAQLV